MPRTATIGPAIYQRVNELVSEGKARMEAIAQVAQERGQQPGTVSANYYRVARQGQTRRASKTGRRRRPTAARKPTRTAAVQQPATSKARSTSDHDDITQIATQIATLTQQLIKQIQDRDAHLRALLN